MAFYVFRCNPKKYDLAGRLADPEPVQTWTARQHAKRIAGGDTAFLWQTGDDRGFRGIMRVEEPASVRPEVEHELKYWREGEAVEEARVVGRLVNRDSRLTDKQIEDSPELADLVRRVTHFMGTNLSLTDGEGQMLLDHAGERTGSTRRTTPER